MKATSEFYTLLKRAVLIPVAIAIVVAGFFLWQIQSLRSSARLVNRSDRVITAAHQLRDLLTESQNNLRGYLLASDANLLQSYHEGEKNLDLRCNEVESLITHLPAQAESLKDICTKASVWFLLTEKSVQKKQSGMKIEAIVKSRLGQGIMTRAQAELGALEEQQALLRNQLSAKSAHVANVATWIGIAFSITLGLLLAFSTRRLLFGLSRSYEGMIQSRDEFLSVASHELKTPLTALRLQLQMALRAMKEGNFANFSQDRIKRSFELSFDQSSRISNLIDELLDVTRIQQGKLSIVAKEVDLTELVQHQINQLRDTLKSVGSEVNLTSSERLLLWCDRFRMEQVIINLLTNAMKYGNGQAIEVKVFREGKNAVVDVTDHGIGIAKTNQALIFERFERAVDSRNISGLGLGLYIAKEIVTAHGGTIDVRSEVGEGSTFEVKLPFRPENRLRA